MAMRSRPACPDHRRAQDLSGVGAGAFRDHERKNAEDEGEAVMRMGRSRTRAPASAASTARRHARILPWRTDDQNNFCAQPDPRPGCPCDNWEATHRPSKSPGKVEGEGIFRGRTQNFQSADPFREIHEHVKKNRATAKAQLAPFVRNAGAISRVCWACCVVARASVDVSRNSIEADRPCTP